MDSPPIRDLQLQHHGLVTPSGTILGSRAESMLENVRACMHGGGCDQVLEGEMPFLSCDDVLSFKTPRFADFFFFFLFCSVLDY